VMESSIFFSPNTPLDRRVEVCTRLNIVTEEALSDRYLGPPLHPFGKFLVPWQTAAPSEGRGLR
jgi:hypothetical protein